METPPVVTLLDVQVSNRPVVRLGDQSRQESRVGDTGYKGGRHLVPVELQGGSTPKQFAPLFDRLGISAEIWCRLVKDFGKLFSVVAGHPQRIDEHRSKSVPAATALARKLASAFPVTTIVIDAALDLLHTPRFDRACSCGALCDNGHREPCGIRGLMIYEGMRDCTRLTRASGEVRARSPRRWLGLNE